MSESELSNPTSQLFCFAQIDHDVCSNYGNWLYSAGIGNDPREDRKFNVVKQGLDYDGTVSYIFCLPETLLVASCFFFPSVKKSSQGVALSL